MDSIPERIMDVNCCSIVVSNFLKRKIHVLVRIKFFPIYLKNIIGDLGRSMV